MISIIAAIGKNRELGKNNSLLWHIPEDLKRFKKLTEGHVVIMGRKTYDSLPKKFQPLPNRVNIVVTRNKNWQAKRCYIVNSIDEAIEKAKQFNKEIFIIGGASIYQQAIKFADKLYLTSVNKKYQEADAFFPKYSKFKKKIFEEKHLDNNPQFIFVEYIK